MVSVISNHHNPFPSEWKKKFQSCCSPIHYMSLPHPFWLPIIPLYWELQVLALNSATHGEWEEQILLMEINWWSFKKHDFCTLKESYSCEGPSASKPGRPQKWWQHLTAKGSTHLETSYLLFSFPKLHSLCQNWKEKKPFFFFFTFLVLSWSSNAINCGQVYNSAL